MTTADTRLSELEVAFENRGKGLQRLQPDFAYRAKVPLEEVGHPKMKLAMLSTKKAELEEELEKSSSKLHQDWQLASKLKEEVSDR